MGFKQVLVINGLVVPGTRRLVTNIITVPGISQSPNTFVFRYRQTEDAAFPGQHQNADCSSVLPQ